MTEASKSRLPVTDGSTHETADFVLGTESVLIDDEACRGSRGSGARHDHDGERHDGCLCCIWTAHTGGACPRDARADQVLAQRQVNLPSATTVEGAISPSTVVATTASTQIGIWFRSRAPCPESLPSISTNASLPQRKRAVLIEFVEEFRSSSSFYLAMTHLIASPWGGYDAGVIRRRQRFKS